MKKLLQIALLFISLASFGQEKQQIKESDYANNSVEMADALRADGKIYVVVAVIVLILIVLIGYTLIIDRKVTRLERLLSNDDKNHTV